MRANPNSQELATVTHRASPRDKILWGSGAVADALMANTVTVLYLAIYSIGYGVSATLLGVVMFIPRLWDMFTDPIMGNISDNTRTRWGRRRPYIPIGGILAGLCFFVMWLPSADWSDMGKLVFFLGSLLLFYTAYTIFVIPWNGLGLELSDDYSDRSSVQGYRIFMAMLVTFIYTFSYKFCFDFTPKIGTSISRIEESIASSNNPSLWESIDLFGNWIYLKLLIVFQPLVEAFFSLYFKVFPGRASLENIELNGVAFVGAVFGIMMLVFAVIPAVFLKERKTRQAVGEKTGFTEAIKTVAGDRNLLCVGSAIFGIFLGFVSTQALTLYMNTYYVFSNLSAEEAKAAAGVMSGKVGVIYTIVGLASIPLIGKYTRWVGKRNAIITGLAIVGTGCLCSFYFFSPSSPQLQLLLPVFFASGLNCVWINSNSMVADICDLDELKTGKRREGVFGATLAWISKLGLAVALLLSGMIVDLTGIDPELGSLQPESTILKMRLMYAGIPSLCLLLSIVLASRFNLTEDRVREVRAELDAKTNTS